MARAILVCCEGKTEKEYFEVIRRVFRIPAYFGLHIEGEKGQHKTLIDKTVDERAGLAERLGIEEVDIEAWSVCDQDKMPCSYADLLGYAEEQGVLLAFARPQFEAYLVQHFEQSSCVKKAELYGKLAGYRARYGASREYNDSVKADLGWLYRALDEKPALATVAITNADQRLRQSADCFMTVQRLTERLLGLGMW